VAQDPAFPARLPAMVASVALVFIVFLLEPHLARKTGPHPPTAGTEWRGDPAHGRRFLRFARSTGGALESLAPYWMIAALAAVYLLDCLTLRFTDTLRNPSMC